jgi:hypothetical protein
MQWRVSLRNGKKNSGNSEYVDVKSTMSVDVNEVQCKVHPYADAF